MTKAVGISSSPSLNSRSGILVARTLAYLESFGAAQELIELVNLPAEALLARKTDTLVTAAIEKTTGANIVVLGTPVYRASFAGQLKAFLDLFPQDSLRNRVVGLIATGAGSAHSLVIDHSLRPLVASLKGLSAARALYITDAQIPDKSSLSEEIETQAKALAEELFILAKTIGG